MLSKSVNIILFFVIIAFIASGCAPTLVQASTYGLSGSGLQADASTGDPLLATCTNIALGKETNASISLPNAPSAQAVDGVLETLWNAQAFAPQWIEINLGSMYTIEELRLYVAQTPPGETTHEIWVADASKVYTQIDTISGFTVDSQILSRTYPSGLTFQWIKIVTTASPSWVAWREIELCQTTPPTSTPTRTPLPTVCNNFALFKPTDASANSAQSGQAVDGSYQTLWNSQVFAPQWIEINLGVLSPVDEIRLYVAQTPAGNTTHEIWVADSSKVYTQVDTISGFTSDGEVLQRIYSPGLTSVQWVKIVTTESPSWVAWYEIEVCQIVSGPTSTSTSTPTGTATTTVTSTATGTSTGTATVTATATLTASATNTPTGTHNPPTNTPTATPTNTPPAGSTNTPTSTPTTGNTSTPTSTSTGTPTSVMTSTPTSTATPTAVLNTPGKITGGGNLGDKATFGLTVNYDRGSSSPRGNITYIDHATGLQLLATDLELLVIDGTHASFSGMAIVNGDQEVWFQVEVEDTNRQGTADWFMITIPALNYEASGTMTGGNITIH